MAFITPSNKTTGREYVLDTPQQQQDFLQFIPATVRYVINSADSAASPENNNNESNCIVVEKNILTDDVNADGMIVEKYRPLLRGFADSIKKGDSVLVTEVGDVGYYLGPLNITNTPSVTDSNLPSSRNDKITSTTYPEDIKFNRLIKDFNVDLDDPSKLSKRIKSPEGKTILSDIHTDLTLEGRHGNSIRIGSRNKFPNIIVNNGRNNNQSFESINDSSIFGMFSQGSILQHFRPEFENQDGTPYSFKLADESTESPSNYIKKSFTSPLGRGQAIDGEADSDIETTIYEYNGAFSILNSDRIIINARKENLFLSALKHIHIGSGNALTFSTSKNTLFNSTERFDINAPEVRLGSAVDEETQPIVLGDALVEKITDLCDQLDQLIGNITKITVTTTQGPSGTPINAAAFQSQTQGISQIASALDEVLSKSNRTT